MNTNAAFTAMEVEARLPGSYLVHDHHVAHLASKALIRLASKALIRLASKAIIRLASKALIRLASKTLIRLAG